MTINTNNKIRIYQLNDDYYVQVPHISGMTNLEKLKIHCAYIESEFKYSFSDLPNLKSLDINWICDNFSNEINKLNNLEELSIVFIDNNKDTIVVLPESETVDEANIIEMNFDKLTKLKKET